MGDKNHNKIWCGPGPAIRFLAATLLGLLVLFFATIGTAKDADLDSPVSTPPVVSTVPSSMTPGAEAAAAKSKVRPLTRAAAKQFVETISPVDWLERFGRVEVGQRP